MNLGPHEEKMRQMILNEEPGDIEKYSVIISAFPNAGDFTQVLFPHKFRSNGIFYYRWCMNQFSILVKVDKQKTKPPFSAVSLAKDGPLFVIWRDIYGSPEFKATLELVSMSKDTAPPWLKKYRP